MKKHLLTKSDKCEEHIILVDELDTEIGSCGKLETHEKGRLHRAFSIFIFNADGQLLLQKRALSKYHSGGLWSNTCCGHPRLGESIPDAAGRRLHEEMGIVCKLKEVFSFLYEVRLSHSLFEHEFDHVLMGMHNDNPSPDPDEASDWKWIDMAALKNDILAHPDNYTYWLRLSIDKVIHHASLNGADRQC